VRTSRISPAFCFVVPVGPLATVVAIDGALVVGYAVT